MGKTADTLDLHGLTVEEAIEHFVQHYNERVKKSQGGAWTIVHGYGSSGQGGVIRSKLRSFLEQHKDKLRYEAGDNFGNPGWTWVYPKIRLPDRQERLALDILGYCSIPRTEEKILGEFIQPDGVKIRELVRALVNQGKLKEVRKGIKVAYQANP
ncbi:MAG: hypothetical protein PCFJNLEI_02034 [Verrucomicrobiae bacterium]|nr:hypothetical protein [Verrucomicrobiae bacterium]